MQIHPLEGGGAATGGARLGALSEAVMGSMHFEFSTAGRIIFGQGALRDAGDIVQELGRRPLVLAGRTMERSETLVALLSHKGIRATMFAVPGEPEVELVRAATNVARTERCDSVIGFGGGSVLDAAKAVAALATNRGDVLDYLEIIGRGKKLSKASLPLMAIPTTAGTGSEVTRNSVIASPEHRLKVSLRSPSMLPRVALVDPELTHTLPAILTATTGLDALTQLIEPFVSRRANPFTDGLCQEGIARAARSLRRAVASAPRRARTGNRSRAPTPEEAAAREDMAVASLFGGLALANAGLGAVHGLAGPLGGMIDAPHGALCAALLSPVLTTNLRALRARDPRNDALRRYDRIAQLLTGARDASADEAVEWLRKLFIDLDIPRLRTYGVGPEHVRELVDKAEAASSMKANPILLTRTELAAIVEAAL
jgi:alcohol dehydrogenase class IV